MYDWTVSVAGPTNAVLGPFLDRGEAAEFVADFATKCPFVKGKTFTWTADYYAEHICITVAR